MSNLKRKETGWSYTGWSYARRKKIILLSLPLSPPFSLTLSFPLLSSLSLSL
ncbi:transmembrane protein, putative [Medicago truncatula]|uniref:Transmembrane protein, putative n=1 Tax=Medicago truncatula TaxID=3880 RepID=G7J2N6_MEDTR|nr:transmembrane protein, putative [Medicago truncatula]